MFATTPELQVPNAPTALHPRSNRSAPEPRVATPEGVSRKFGNFLNNIYKANI